MWLNIFRDPEPDSKKVPKNSGIPKEYGPDYKAYKHNLNVKPLSPQLSAQRQSQTSTKPWKGIKNVFVDDLDLTPEVPASKIALSTSNNRTIIQNQ